ncbi:MAG TPA: ATP-dependent DNA ligase [Bacteroidia bacterium]|jgi:DNA ligase-1|nr:ATP-dependent DNA ligase [Bacteroidia bacterium]
MKAFSELYTAIDETTKTNAKINALVHYFSTADEKDAIWCVAMLSGRRPKRTIKSGELKAWCMEIAQIPEWLFLESYSVVGDLSETITLMLPPPKDPKKMLLNETIQLLKALEKASDQDKRNFIQTTWEQLTTPERFIFNKLITGGFRIGVSQQLVVKALAKNYKLDENIVSHRLTGNWDPETTSLKTLLFSDNANDDHSKPYPFYLAYQLDQEVETLGDVSEWQIERKYDGIRGQIIIRDHQLFVWSRGEDLITEKFPEFAELVGLLPQGTVLDGEILPVREGVPLPFHIMQTRIGRKNVTKKNLQDAPLVLMCYDLLEFNGTDMRSQPLEVRRKELENLVQQVALKTSNSPLLISPLLSCMNWEEVKSERLRSREFLCEGLMLKKKQSIYESGRRRGNWWKWKVDALTVDGVMIYAQRGSGRRANLYTDYTFAIWDGEELVPFTKAYSGLTDKEILEVDNWIKKHTIDKFGPVRSVTASLVFEIAFEGIQPSPRHKSGIALRFPRIVRWRKDKNAKEANTKNDLLQLIESLKIDGNASS